MRIRLVAVGRKMPDWVNEGFSEYQKRLSHAFRLELIEVDSPRRGAKAPVRPVVEEEGVRLLQAVPKGSHRIALDEKGRSYTSESLAIQLGQWMRLGSDLALLIGGPDGLSSEVRDAADEHWSLSPLTLAHPLVRIVMAEQLYRAYAILEGLPYHRSGRIA
ncbi:MAG: 23S rRNA (pseudouridine(1915)-N(3))-methyltransferase RlmH [Gammaproteobacteria bacterium]